MSSSKSTRKPPSTSKARPKLTPVSLLPKSQRPYKFPYTIIR